MSGEIKNNSNNTNEAVKAVKTKPSALDELLEWIESFVFAIFVVMLVFIFLYRTVVVDGESMEPTLYNEQRLILTHFNYKPQHGDIVVCNSRGLGKTIIKRCIGVAGDTVVIDYSDNTIKVNGDKIDMSYLGEPMNYYEWFDKTYQVSEFVFEYHVPEGCIFALGDNRNHSRDSRDSAVGFISTEDVLGKAAYRFYPFDSFKKLS